ncbi:MAG: hypothetical protein ACR2L6_07540 [Gemmatimonadaceae bacterium]
MAEKLKHLLAEYGPVAVGIYLVLFFGVFVGIYFAINAGWAPEGVAGNAGAWTAAYLATKLTQPLRIGATVVLTPLVSRLWHRNAAKEGPVNPGG